MPLLEPHQHVDWIADEVTWFDRLDDSMLDAAVPTCPGWDVTAVLNHLRRGLGTVWVELLRADADVDGLELYRTAPAPVTGPAALSSFHDTMPTLVEQLRHTDPDKPCWWFAGPVPARYLFWLGATELSVHRADVAFVIGESPVLTGPKAHDALELSCQFMPNIWTKLRQVDTPPPVRLCAIDVDIDTIVGSGEPVATVTGTASDLRLRLWGRPAAGVIEVDGDAAAFETWTTSSPKGPID